ncbi:MAG: ADP-ribosylglycohydrolase family protein [Spirochaetaceae bacterium]|jgi:ADP-ribosylglycohydrolase|nr:ADP-ribosylglycohydrolase family protein [Spirochaetaceae bacterium]
MMLTLTEDIRNRVYAGVLGKIIGVYMGRPVEGWSYKAIIDRFGEVDRYVNRDLGIPLIVADDDISGTFGFFRTMEDHGYPENLVSSMVGDTWLDYIIEDKTILWWGGLGRSTEHTAFLRLKEGIRAPQSGSIALNGKTLAEQIGAQIFIDAFAMMCPNDPERAARYVREVAKVSHDGMAVEAAVFLGAMEADAFSQRDINVLIDRNIRFVSDSFLLKMIEDIRSICSRHAPAWRAARAEIDERYGYHKFNGPCHIIPNHAMVLASLLLGGDDFHRSLTIASSAAWDTDCNAGNVGCLNGIRLGLDALNKPAELREAVADRILVVSSDGGSCVSDAVIEADRILRTAERIGRGSSAAESADGKSPRFSFAFPGSVQGFMPCPYAGGTGHGAGRGNPDMRVSNGNTAGLQSGLRIILNGTNTGSVSSPTSIDFDELARNFSTLASPTLYEGQTVELELEVFRCPVQVAPYILYYTADQRVERKILGSHRLSPGRNVIQDAAPFIGGMPIFRFGLDCTGESEGAEILVTRIDWSNTPVLFAQRGMMMQSIWETKPYWFRGWVSSAKQFAADFTHTLCISHTEQNGVVTIGTRDWSDYEVETNLIFSLHQAGGLVLRSRGHRLYYGLLFSGGDTLSIIECVHGKETVLQSIPFAYRQDIPYKVIARVKENRISVAVDGRPVLEASSGRYRDGAAGFRVDRGTMIVRDFILRRC